MGPSRALAARWCAAGALAAAVVLIASCGSESARPTATAPAGGALQSIGAGLMGPAGLQATVYAQGMPHVAALAFDPQGRLWIATAAYSDDNTDAIYVVAQPGGTPIKVVTGIHTPLGLLWYQDSLYVTSKERVDSYSGFDGTRFAGDRTIVTLPEGVGEVNGIVLSPDGRMVVGISAPCDHCTPALEDSAAVVSFEPDGSDLRVEASGIRAPIGLAYYPGTSDLFVTMNQRDDLGGATPGDWLAVVRQGDAWGFPNCYGQGGAVCQGVPAPIAVLDKHAAVSGVAIVTGQFGSAVGNAAIVAEWSLGKVQVVRLDKAGSAYKGSVEPFLTGIENPVPVLLTPDGAVLVGDWTTGTIYKITKG